MMKYYRGTYLNDEEFETDGDMYYGDRAYNALFKVQDDILLEIKTEYFIINSNDNISSCPNVTITKEISKEEYERL